MNKVQKQSSIELAKSILSDNQMFVLFDYKGLNATDVVRLRNELKDKNANMKVLKNTLFKKAIEGTDFEFLNEYFHNQIAVSYSNDPIALSNVIFNFAKDNDRVEIKIASLDGKAIDNAKIKDLASLGSLDDVRARFIGMLRAPGSQLVRVLAAYKEKLEA